MLLLLKIARRKKGKGTGTGKGCVCVCVGVECLYSVNYCKVSSMCVCFFVFFLVSNFFYGCIKFWRNIFFFSSFLSFVTSVILFLFSFLFPSPAIFKFQVTVYYYFIKSEQSSSLTLTCRVFQRYFSFNLSCRWIFISILLSCPVHQASTNIQFRLHLRLRGLQ